MGEYDLVNPYRSEEAPIQKTTGLEDPQDNSEDPLTPQTNKQSCIVNQFSSHVRHPPPA
jgi:hypothetical protein